jgi:hypothetical protein
VIAVVRHPVNAVANPLASNRASPAARPSAGLNAEVENSRLFLIGADVYSYYDRAVQYRYFKFDLQGRLHSDLVLLYIHSGRLKISGRRSGAYFDATIAYLRPKPFVSQIIDSGDGQQVPVIGYVYVHLIRLLIVFHIN